MHEKRVILIGATGSIGNSTLQVIRQHPDRLKLVAVASGSNSRALEAIANEFGIDHTVVAKRDGSPAVAELVREVPAEVVLVASTGCSGLEPTLAAIHSGKDVALANKEVLVLAGSHVIREAERNNVRILPVDSEHNAIFQCLRGLSPGEVKRIILTASGGPFWRMNRDEMAVVTPEDALTHPNWEMGPKITVDSASMANKGLEMIEARWLFGLSPDQIDVVIHPQSIIHSMVECVDGSILAQLSPPSMTFAIRHALFFPERVSSPEPGLSFLQRQSLEFEPPDLDRFPCLRLALQAMRQGDPYPAVFNAANEVAVSAFLKKNITFLAISQVIDHCLGHSFETDHLSLAKILDADARARKIAKDYLLNFATGFIPK